MKIEKFNDFNSEKTCMIDESMTHEEFEGLIRGKIRDLIASDWAKHEDDYPYVEQTADSCMDILREEGLI